MADLSDKQIFRLKLIDSDTRWHKARNKKVRKAANRRAEGHMARSNATLKSLLKRGLVECEEHPESKLYKLWTLTAEGKEIADEHPDL